MQCPLGGMNYKSSGGCAATPTRREQVGTGADTSISNRRSTAGDYRPPCSMTPRKTVAPECSTSRVAVSRTSRWRSATSRR